VVSSINKVSSLHPKLSNEFEILGNRFAEIQAQGSVVERNLTSQLASLNLKVKTLQRSLLRHENGLIRKHQFFFRLVELKNQMETYLQ